MARKILLSLQTTSLRDAEAATAMDENNAEEQFLLTVDQLSTEVSSPFRSLNVLTIPLDIAALFDADDKTRYFSHGDTGFPSSCGCLGRDGCRKGQEAVRRHPHRV